MRPSDDGGVFVMSIPDYRLRHMTSADIVVEAMNADDPFRYLLSLLAEADGKTTLFTDGSYEESKTLMEAFRALERHSGLHKPEKDKSGD